MSKRKTNILLGSGVITAFASSLCCITPLLAFIAGTSGAASSFSWMEPFRPYLIGLTIIVLGLAWFQKLKPRKAEEIQCDCEEDNKKPFMQTKLFLSIVTAFAALMLAFPYYSSVFYPENKQEVVDVNPLNIQILELDIEGMTCEACNKHVEHAAQEIVGVIEASADFSTGKAVVKFDETKISSETVAEAICKTGYTIKNHE